MKKLLFLSLAVFLFFCLIKAAGGDKYYVVIDGIPGECQDAGHVNEIEAWAFNFEVTQPIDASSGIGKGARIYGPITLTKKIDKASPKIFEACIKGLSNKRVVLKFYKTINGVDQLYYQLTLSNVIFFKFKQYKNLESPWPGNTNPDLEEVSMTFYQIDIENPRDGTKVSDSWKLKK